jgi:hypothetical protein
LYIVLKDQFQEKPCLSSIKAHWCFIFILNWSLIRLQAGCCPKILLPGTASITAWGELCLRLDKSQVEGTIPHTHPHCSWEKTGEVGFGILYISRSEKVMSYNQSTYVETKASTLEWEKMQNSSIFTVLRHDITDGDTTENKALSFLFAKCLHLGLC